MKKSNIYIIGNRKEYVPYEKEVHIHRAPTDESIKIYKEMEDKAQNSLIGRITLQDNILNFKAALFKDDLTCETVCRFKLLINGNEISKKITIGDSSVSIEGSDVARKIIDRCSEIIAVEIFKHIASDSLKITRR